MGTNYYLICKTCGSELHHIGKQSAGHNFSSDWSKEEVEKWLNDNVEIKDEYGKVHSWNWLKDRVWDIRRQFDNREDKEFNWC